MKARDAQKKQATRAKLKGKPGLNLENVTDEYEKDELRSPTEPAVENSRDKEIRYELENKSNSQFADSKNKNTGIFLADKTLLDQTDNFIKDDVSEEGWQKLFQKVVHHSVSAQAAGRLFSYKEVALAPPGVGSSDSSKGSDTSNIGNYTVNSTNVQLLAGSKNTVQLLKKTSSVHEEIVEDKEGNLDLSNEYENIGSLPNEAENQSNGSANPLPPEAEKQSDSETGKEPAKKLFAITPPYNPFTFPVFGSVPVPVHTEQGGIFSPSLSIASMIAVNPARRSPHQSATTRTPHGPRLSGGYNRSGNGVPRNKPFHNGEFNGDPNAYLAPSNGITFSQNGYPISLNGIETLPNGFLVSINGMLETQNGIPLSPVDLVEFSLVDSVEVPDKNQNEVEAKGSIEGSSNNLTVMASSTLQNVREEPRVSEVTQSDQSGGDEQSNCGPEETPTNKVAEDADILSA
ncbi:Hypothetical predicted protein [Olea europaea subsp. europaea]|uniref:Uncharacterized protein n=1 Tax=Olea europaea subsp. europaea TaxID=158383 RepID=A0A8S0QRX0_OLEEU|nr:Hypothetical predicted protein [Olea europaea subsp. europaea]